MNPKLLAVEREVAARTRSFEERTERTEQLRKELDDLSAEIDLLSKVEAVLQTISAQVLGQSTETIDKLVTAGLHTVFPDQPLTFKTTVDKFRGKTSIRFELFEAGQTAPLTEAYGGGVLVVIGVLLRVTTIILLKQRRILLLDETLSHLSADYIPGASKLLRKLAEELNFTILMVSHQQEFAQNANRQYAAKRTRAGTTFEVVGQSRQGTVPTGRTTPSNTENARKG
jgi:DNA repair exonuclease SbcCD ATPase subunit